MTYEVEHTEAEWRALLSPDAFRILRQAGTEPAFGNELWDNHEDGVYRCAGCGTALFEAADKYDSGTGWPSFVRPVAPGVVETRVDAAHGMVRTEVRCAECGGHLGHIFTDGPQPTGERYCMNSGALTFDAREA